MRTKKLSGKEWVAMIVEQAGCDFLKDYPKSFTNEVVSSVTDAEVVLMIEGIKKSGSFYLPGVGKFFLKTHKGHPCNLDGGKKSVASYEVIKFKPDESFRRQVVKSPEVVVHGSDS